MAQLPGLAGLAFAKALLIALLDIFSWFLIVLKGFLPTTAQLQPSCHCFLRFFGDCSHPHSSLESVIYLLLCKQLPNEKFLSYNDKILPHTTINNPFFSKTLFQGSIYYMKKYIQLCRPVKTFGGHCKWWQVYRRKFPPGFVFNFTQKFSQPFCDDIIIFEKVPFEKINAS